MRHPPEILRPLWSMLADITGWFNWEALSAIGTVGALWFVIVQTTRSGRAERAKSIGILTFLIGLVEPIEVVPLYEGTDDAELKSESSTVVDLGLSVVRRAIRGIESLPLADASAAGVVEWTMALPLALRDIEEVLATRTIQEPSTMQSSLRYILEATRHFRLQRDRLRFVLPVRVLLRLIRKGSVARFGWRLRHRRAQ